MDRAELDTRGFEFGSANQFRISSVTVIWQCQRLTSRDEVVTVCDGNGGKENFVAVKYCPEMRS